MGRRGCLSDRRTSVLPPTAKQVGPALLRLCKPRANALPGKGVRSFKFTEKSIRSSLLLALVLTEQGNAI